MGKGQEEVNELTQSSNHSVAATDEPLFWNNSERKVSGRSGYGCTPHPSCCEKRKEQPLKVMNRLNGK